MKYNIFYRIDKYNVKNYRNLPILGIALFVFFLVIWVAAKLLLIYEVSSDHENVTSFEEAFWLCFMAASTIGFGDYYPVTTGGRFIIGSMFIQGGVMLGIIVGLIANAIMSFTDTNVKNRELKRQMHNLTGHNEKLEIYLADLHFHNETLYQHNKQIEEKLDILMKHVDDTTPELKMEKLHE